MKKNVILLTAFIMMITFLAGCSLNDLANKDTSSIFTSSVTSRPNSYVPENIPPTSSRYIADAKISNSAAKQIVLNHAGVKESDITGYKLKLEREDGVVFYEIEFNFSGYEYDYKVSAETGKIIKAEKERID